MAIIPLKCPVCGGSVSRETLKCEYCGASFILSKDESTLLPKKSIACPECGQELPEGSIVCLQCGKMLTKNKKEIKKLKYLQNKIRDSQKKMRELIPKEVLLEDTEYIFSVQSLSFKPKKYFIVTDKRLISYEEGKVVEIKYGDIVTIHQPAVIHEFGWLHPKEKWIWGIETFDGDFTFNIKTDNTVRVFSEFTGISMMSEMMTELYSKAKYALELSEKKIKDVNIIFQRFELKE